MKPNVILPIQPGTKVRVSDGNPQPPARFNRKLREWQNNNYDAVVVGEQPASQWRPEPEYRLQHCDYLSGFMLVFRSATADKVKPIEGAERYIVKDHGMDQIVEGIEQ